MGEKIVVGPINRGLKTDREPFVIDNDSFPVLINAYQWRGRIKRKRGTALLGRLQRFFNSSSTAYTLTSTISFDGSGNTNLLTGFSLQTNGNIISGSVTIIGSVGPVTYTDPTKDGFLTPTGTGGPNTINYATGAILIPAQAGGTATATFLYYADLPVLGLRDLNLSGSQFPKTLAFDTNYSYNISVTSPYIIYDVSFYKNPATAGLYTAKSTVTPTSWNGQDYQQFWTTNYQGALWATNGANVPFSAGSANISMQFAPTSSITYTSNAATTLTLSITNCPLVVGDFVFLNEWTGANASTLNFQSGFVTAAAPNSPPLAVKTITITLPNATLGVGPYTPGIVQYLTNRSDTTKDCLRWYDGDPTDGNPTTPTLNGGLGWVNFCPPLSQGAFSISNTVPQQYYLVGAKTIVPFKDRLLFIGPVIQTSTAGSQQYLQDTIIYSQNGTPFYTASFTGSVTSASTNFNQILVPVNQTATANAYFADSTGFGGNVNAGFAQPIVSVGQNEDVLILGFANRQAKLVYTGDDLLPFLFYVINSEKGSGSTFSAITMDKGVFSTGNAGIVITSQVESERIDLDIPDQIFEFNLISNGPERVTAQRDFINEWIYFTYLSNQQTWKFPNQTLQFNYRDNSWAIFNECFTTYGQFRKATGFTWATIPFATWESWDQPWNAGSSTLLQREVIGGNQQGFVMLRVTGTNESNSIYIQSFSGNTITSPDHCLNNGDYIIITGCIGTVSALVNGRVFSVYGAAQNTFKINPSIGSGTYSGGGVIKRMYMPFFQTKQFPTSWGNSRKTRIGAQQYLLSTTAASQITLLIYLSQDADNAYNFLNFPFINNIVPSGGSLNNAMIYSSILYTCPEGTNLGLTPANINLQMPTAINDQQQIWHRVNTSLLGDTVQLGFTMSDDQMRSFTTSTNVATITAATNATQCVLTCTNTLALGNMVLIQGVVGMTQLNGNIYIITARNSSSITINVDSSAFGVYVSGGTATFTDTVNQFSEIELHAMILDVSASSLLA